MRASRPPSATSVPSAAAAAAAAAAGAAQEGPRPEVEPVGCRTLFATHYSELAQLTGLGDDNGAPGAGGGAPPSGAPPPPSLSSSAIGCYRMHVVYPTAPASASAGGHASSFADMLGRVIFTHRVVPGVGSGSLALHVAALAGVPPPVLRRAHALRSAPPWVLAR